MGSLRAPCNIYNHPATNAQLFFRQGTSLNSLVPIGYPGVSCDRGITCRTLDYPTCAQGQLLNKEDT